MSVHKLLNRIIAPDPWSTKTSEPQGQALHDHSYGISSDPLTQFALHLAALMHDVDHSGVPNTRLMEENPNLAAMYQYQSVAEKNSIELSWDLFLDERYERLRQAVYGTAAEFQRFRRWIVQSVLATDVLDRDLNERRSARWKKAFPPPPGHDESDQPPNQQQQQQHMIEDRDPERSRNRKATLIMEHLIQASDVAHTMQHWHVYRKWNERLFLEHYEAFVDGRATQDPSLSWYSGELRFFDHYVIPLAHKLKDCGVFCVSSDEYLTYAQQNRAEWERKGQEVVSEYLQKVSRQYHQDD